MRDPVFYQIHSYVDDLFQLHKAKLEPYSVQQLSFDGVVVESLQVGAENVLNTFWQQSDVNMVRGLDFSPRGDVFARITHLQHEPFTTTIRVRNESAAMRAGTCRIFMAPKLGFTKKPMSFDEQRHLMIEIDKFIVQCEEIESFLHEPVSRLFPQ
jgi:tyrosinase